MKKLLILFACIISLHALAINIEQATLVTRNFLQENNITKENSLSEFSLMEIVKKEEINIFYIMKLGDDEGFVIVSASEYLPPIFGYSFENNYEGNASVQYYLDIYSNYVLNEKKSNNVQNEDLRKEWYYYLQEDFTPNRFIANGGTPLITTKWNQSKFYNTYCPWDKRSNYEYDYRVPNGCVALAAAQFMNYYRYPERGKYNYTYKPYYYPQQTVLASQQVYYWDAMCDVATNYTNEIAKLAYHLGVTVQMQYAPGGSGAMTETLAEVLNENFSYSVAEKWSVYDSSKLKKEINALRPILMSGCLTDGGGCHAYLVDGYQENTGIRFHFNWGWGGASNGYFLLDENPFRDGGLAFINMRPMTYNVVQCEQFKRQTANEGYITNGSTNKPYQSAPDCSWMIAAPGAKSYSFSFSRLDTQEDIDVVTIYNGSKKSSGIAATFSGMQTPDQTVTVEADSVLITFTSTAQTSVNSTHLGFLMRYKTNKPPQKCDEITTLKNSSGFITDGTLPNENYMPWVSCTWNITPDFNTGFFGLFHEFDLRLGDFVDIYDASTSLTYPNFWKRYDKYSPPVIGEVINMPFSRAQIRFITDNFDQGNGFKFQYFSKVGVNNNTLLNHLDMFPNPATEVVNLSFSSELMNQTIYCRLVDLWGRELYSTDIEYNGDYYATQIPVAKLSNGIYFLQIITQTGSVTSKIIKN